MLQRNLTDIQISLANETKSSAGDKYETARAMLHAAQENLSNQINVLLQQRAIVESLDPLLENYAVGPGAVVATTYETLYISTAGGRVDAGCNSVITISPSAPLAQQMWGLKAGATLLFNGKKYLINSVS